MHHDGCLEILETEEGHHHLRRKSISSMKVSTLAHSFSSSLIPPVSPPSLFSFVSRLPFNDSLIIKTLQSVVCRHSSVDSLMMNTDKGALASHWSIFLLAVNTDRRRSYSAIVGCLPICEQRQKVRSSGTRRFFPSM